MQHFELYSSILWASKDTEALRILAIEMLDKNRNNPETWCFLGQLRSLEGDHNRAIEDFSHALDFDPYFSHAYSFKGHEHYLVDDLVKSHQCYEDAIMADKRHYQAW